MRKVQVIDSHTEGEPTRCVLGQPDLPGSDIGERVASFQRRFEDTFRPLLLEPRTYEAVVGAWVGPSTAPDCFKDVVFFNPAGVLGMCGHGTIGIMATLAYQGLAPGSYRLNTPVGVVSADLLDHHTVQVKNVKSHRIAKDVELDVLGTKVIGDVAWGGNTFFLVRDCPITISADHLEELATFTKAVMRAANEQGYPAVNHVEVFGPPDHPDAHSKNYVLCPGGEYDRSPCGTGTSAKLACLAADGKLAPGDVWVQESVIGTVYRCWYQRDGDVILPTIEGSAYVTGETTLVFEDGDPMGNGIVK
jgi:4-hydroxyproline epimerase